MFKKIALSLLLASPLMGEQITTNIAKDGSLVEKTSVYRVDSDFFLYFSDSEQKMPDLILSLSQVKKSIPEDLHQFLIVESDKENKKELNMVLDEKELAALDEAGLKIAQSIRTLAVLSESALKVGRSPDSFGDSDVFHATYAVREARGGKGFRSFRSAAFSGRGNKSLEAVLNDVCQQCLDSGVRGCKLTELRSLGAGNRMYQNVQLSADVDTQCPKTEKERFTESSLIFIGVTPFAVTSGEKKKQSQDVKEEKRGKESRSYELVPEQEAPFVIPRAPWDFPQYDFFDGGREYFLPPTYGSRYRFPPHAPIQRFYEWRREYYGPTPRLRVLPKQDSRKPEAPAKPKDRIRGI